MIGNRRRLTPVFTTVLALTAGVVVWFPLVVASQTPVSAESPPVVDQRAEAQIGPDVAGDDQRSPMQQSAPFFNALCATDTGLWAQTILAGMTGHLVAVDLSILRRSPDITAPVVVEIRTVDDAGYPTDVVLGRGSATTTIASHRSTPSWLSVPLDVPIQLRRSQRVAIFPTSTPSASGACYEWISGGLNQYSGGAIGITHDFGTTFAIESAKDATIRTWMR
jgi:hypothetical protein